MKEDEHHPLSLYVSVSSGKSLFVLVLYELDKLDEFFSVLVLKEIIIIIIIIPEIILLLFISHRNHRNHRKFPLFRFISVSSVINKRCLLFYYLILCFRFFGFIRISQISTMRTVSEEG